MSDSSDSSNSEDYRREKLKKKERKKSKKEKKSKKKKKRSRRDSDTDSPVPAKLVRNDTYVQDVQTRIVPTVSSTEPPSEADAFGPALPPHLQKRIDPEPEPPARSVVGPTLPPGINLDYTFANQQEEEEIDMIGPLPTGGDVQTMTTAQIELEQRALELKLAKLDNSSSSSNVNEKVREEWMLELPEVGLKKGDLTNLKRAFKTKEGPDFTDRTSWTKTPNDEKNPKPSSSKIKEVIQAEANSRFERQRDEEQEKMARKHKKKHKRDESLMDIHLKKLKKEKELKAKEGKSERRPFTRDVDLKPNKVDSSRTKTIINAAKILNTKFSTGKAKYL